MASEVNSRRSYDAKGRRAQSAATRQRIVDSARELILERGYRATTVAQLAALAGVNVDTVYELVGRKPMVLRELIEQALSGTNRAVVAKERPGIAAVRAEPDPVVKLALYARTIREIHQRMAPLFLALRDASWTEPEAHKVWRQISDRRAANRREFVTVLQEAGGLRAGLSIDDAADTVWATSSPDLYVLLTVERGWSPLRYEAWLADSWRRLLLD
jgi:AcrR family transcriptional regulator